jgi:hypothetical protein
MRACTASRPRHRGLRPQSDVPRGTSTGRKRAYRPGRRSRLPHGARQAPHSMARAIRRRDGANLIQPAEGERVPGPSSVGPGPSAWGAPEKATRSGCRWPRSENRLGGPRRERPQRPLPSGLITRAQAEPQTIRQCAGAAPADPVPDHPRVTWHSGKPRTRHMTSPR